MSAYTKLCHRSGTKGTSRAGSSSSVNSKSRFLPSSANAMGARRRAVAQLLPLVGLTAACGMLAYSFYINGVGRWRLQDAAQRPAVHEEAFTRYQCTGEELRQDEIYTAPFRFHVYNDMPEELLDDVIRRAEKYWLPDHRYPRYLVCRRHILTKLAATTNSSPRLVLQRICHYILVTQTIQKRPMYSSYLCK